MDVKDFFEILAFLSFDRFLHISYSVAFILLHTADY